MTFLREPFARFVSEYKHFVRHHGDTRSFQEFLEAPETRNRQSGLVGEAGGYAFIGLAERFEDDVREIEDAVRPEESTLEKVSHGRV